ncbi:aldo/keto reductase family protein [Symbiobacterium thermophilum]|uniref:Aldo/keto reductase n=3 Tax=Symbiobacterium thermophilum TaxID=2734 RepID=A0A953LL63_SYMTR|nr:aldo/keto reductase family protein [Symbiobacterium thermophilum]MBY6277807.1 aldo/keto reductase [Symbiobacterium thermophilum]BAD41493.1 putative potassium channel beta subunit [Symbiobacterium thermophilum IAM 14863]
MEYRRLGSSGLKLSEISLGSWLTYGSRVEAEAAKACIRTAYEHGINHFDCAVVYGAQPHQAEEVVGEALREFPRHTYTVTSKVFWKVGPSTYDQGLSRKHLIERVEMSLKAMKLDYIDIYYAHRFDPETDLEETLRAFDDLVAQGKILYWGFSQWTPAQIERAAAIVDKRNLRRPVVSQPVYNMIDRGIEQEVMPICAREGIGQVVYSPLAQGVLTGKYKPGMPIPEGSRGADPKYGKFVQRYLSDEEMLRRIQQLQPIAERNGLTMAQLALAWVLRRPEVTSAIIGATRPEQVVENVKASGVKLSEEDLKEIDRILGYAE